MKADLAWEIGETAHALRRYFNRRVHQLGVTRAQWRVLVVLGREPGLKQVALADRLDIEPITLSRIVDRLEQSGLVARKPDPADRRAWRLELTAEAAPLRAQLIELANEMASEAFEGLAPDEIAKLRAQLASVRGRISEQEEARRAVA